uniref:Uncharacterized protein n=1 Tax=Brassica campestris TaxID=3711 RepID=M4ECQ4_BRACM
MRRLGPAEHSEVEANTSQSKQQGLESQYKNVDAKESYFLLSSLTPRLQLPSTLSQTTPAPTGSLPCDVYGNRPAACISLLHLLLSLSEETMKQICPFRGLAAALSIDGIYK